MGPSGPKVILPAGRTNGGTNNGFKGVRFIIICTVTELQNFVFFLSVMEDQIKRDHCLVIGQCTTFLYIGTAFFF